MWNAPDGSGGGRRRLRLLPRSLGRRERRERKRERGFEKHPSTQAIDRTRSFRRGDLTLRALSPLTLNPGVGPDARTKHTVPIVIAVLGDVHFITVMGWDDTEGGVQTRIIAQLGSNWKPPLQPLQPRLDSALIRSLLSLRWHVAADSWPVLCGTEGRHPCV